MKKNILLFMLLLAFTGVTTAQSSLHVKYMNGSQEVIDELNMGLRPIGAWTEPFAFTMYTEGTSYTVNVLDFAPSDDMFLIGGEELPFEVTSTNPVNLTLTANGTTPGTIERQFLAITDSRAAHVWPLTAELYQPQTLDVWELAYSLEIGPSFSYMGVPSQITSATLHNDYTLPFPEIPEGYDAVYKLVLDHDQILDASVTGVNDGKVALYTEDFNGEDGPMATNAYNSNPVIQDLYLVAGTYYLVASSTTENFLVSINAVEVPSCTVEHLIYVLNDDLLTVTLYGHEDGTNASGELHIVDSVLLNNRYCHVVAIGKDAFLNCTGLSGSLTLPQTLVTIGSGAFYGCIGLTGSLTIPNSVTLIGHDAFYDCTGFNGIQSLGDGLTTIGDWAFHGCNGFTGSLTIPDAVTTIGEVAFENCSGFNGTLTLGSALDTISVGAFAACNNFTDIVSRATTPPVLGPVVFYEWDTIAIPVTVPCGSGTAYSSISWGGFSNFIEDCHNDNVVHAQYYPYPNNSDSPYTVAYWDIELTDDFETGDFSKSPWQMDALYPWVICDTVSHSGTYCMRSGNIGQNNTASTMTVTMNIPKDGMISFYAKISCEDPWDKGYFYIDDVQKGGWAGEIDWMECQYPVTAGQHTFLWKYEKDSQDAAGDDCFYIDDIVFFSIAPPTEPCDPSAAPSTDLFDVYRAKADGTDLTLLAEDYNSHYYVDSTWTNLPHDVNYKYGITYANDTLFVWSNLLHTKLDVPQNLVTADDKVFNDEQITISWKAITSTAFQKYNVYRDGEKIGETTANTYTDGPLAYNMRGYVYYVTAVYYEMDESAPSNTVNVKVSGYGNVNGYVYEQDSVTGIAGATVTLTGNDEFGESHAFDFTTDNNGYYNGHIYAGSYNGQASHDDYQTTDEPVQGDPVVIHYNQTTSPIDFIMEDLWIENGVSISVLLNSADSPEGVHVVLNQDSIQASLNTMGDDELEIILDETGYYVWDDFRKGTYYVEISMEGYETIHDTLAISSYTDMRYVMTEILYSPKDVYVSRTGWVTWQPGNRHLEAYRVVLTDLNDHSLYTENVSTNALQLPTDTLVDNTIYKLKVANLYSTGQSEYVECNWLYTSCDHLEGFSEIVGIVSPVGVNLSWTYPGTTSIGEPMAVSLFIDGQWQGFVNGNNYYDAQGTFNSRYEARMVYNGDTICPNNNIYMSMSCLEAVTLVGDEYTITATANPSSGGTIQGAGTYHYNETCTLTATPNTGYHFLNWSQGGNVVTTDNTFSFTVTHDSTFVANFEINNYEITATADPLVGGSVSGAGNYDHFDTCTLVAAPAVGYHFVNWTQGGTEVGTSLTYQFEVTGSAAFVANFEINSYDVTATSNPAEGGTVSGDGIYNHGSTVTMTAMPNTGYHFLNWSQNGNVITTDETFSFNITQDTAFVANFELNSYEIAASANPAVGGTVTGAGTYNHFEECTLTATEGEGYTFVNWTENGQEVATTMEYTFTVTGPRTLVANFSLNSYEITVSGTPTNGGSVSGGGTYNHFETCTLTATPAEGYHFVKWTLNGSEVSTSETYSFEVNGPADYVAHFQLNRYVITVNHTTGGSVTGGGNYNHFAICTLRAIPSTGYHFVNWTENGQEVSTNATYTFTVTGDRTLVANFEQNSYNITATANPTSGGTITGAGSYTHGQTCTLVATPNQGYYFVEWTKGNEVVSTEEVYSFEVTESATYRARFERFDYSITAEANPEEGGTITGTGETFHYNSTCQLVAHANTGYHFVNWTLDGTVVATTTIYSFVVTASAHYVAHFEIDTFEITATADPEEGGTVTGGGTYAYGQEVVLMAEANVDYRFVNWTEGDEIVSEEATVTFVVTESRHLVAHFINTVGVGETEGIHFTIYPNPASEKLTVECETPVRQCEIFNMAGAKVYAAKDCTQKFEIGLDNLSVGTYIIRLTSDHFTQTKRFVKE